MCHRDDRLSARLGRGPLLGLIALLVGCGGESELKATPNALYWKEVNFVGWPDDMPDGGYEAQTVTLTNLGKGRMDVVIEGFDDDHLCIEGYSGSLIQLPGLAAGQSIDVPIGVCGYSVEDGERGSLVRGDISFTGPGDADVATVAFQFTPVVDQETDDTGL